MSFAAIIFYPMPYVDSEEEAKSLLQQMIDFSEREAEMQDIRLNTQGVVFEMPPYERGYWVRDAAG